MSLSANKQLLVIAVLCLSVIVAVNAWLKNISTSTSSPDTHIENNNVTHINVTHCNFNKGCDVKVEDFNVMVKLSRPVVLLKPFNVDVTIKSNSTRESLSNILYKPTMSTFAMKHMNMGLNRFEFNKLQKNKWQAKVLLPICSQQRIDWLMEISMEAGNNKVYKLTFPITASPS